MAFALKPSEYAPAPLPALSEWEGLWAAWDAVTQRMLPQEELLDQPIKLRNACIFYLGHIPAFLDIQLGKATHVAPTDPAHYHAIFERGIDPDVDDPAQCHAHSEIPDEWPPVKDILAYQGRVRGRLTSMYVTGHGAMARHVSRAVWVAFEHEAMHLETLLYMMLQSDKTLPPPVAPRPDFKALAERARGERTTNEWFNIPRQTITIGMVDPESASDSSGYFGW